MISAKALRFLVMVPSCAGVLLLSGCAQWARDRADDKLKKGQYEEAIADLREGLKRYPDHNVLRTGLLTAQNEALAKLTQQINQQRGFGQYDEALKTVQRAAAIEPNNPRLATLSTEIEQDRRSAKSLKEAADLVTSGKRQQALRVIELALREAPRQAALLALQRRLEGELRAADPSLGIRALVQTRPMTLDFRNAPLSGVLAAITSASGINFIVDRDVKQDGRVTTYLREARVDDALELVLGSQALARRIVDPTTVLIYPNTPEKQREHQELVVRVFHLANAEAKTTAALLRAMLKLKEPFVDERANLVAIREPADVVALAERLVALHDVSDAEVMLEVEILEVSSSRLTSLGINYPNSLSLTPLTAAGAATGLTLNDLRGVNGDRLGASISATTLNLRSETGDANVLANPRIRAKNREKAHIVIGDKVPVVTTSSTATGIVGQNVNYLEVGLKLDVEPQISPDEEVTLKIALESSSITQQITTGNGGTAYQIGTRNASTVLRLRDGETQLLGGLISNADKNNAAQIPGLGDLPILGRLFGTRQGNAARNELVLAITPRIIRGAARPDIEQAQLWIGTEQTPRLKSSPAANASISAPASPAFTQAPASLPIKAPALTWTGAKEVKVGEEFSVTLNLSTPYAVRGLPLELSYSPSHLDVIEVIEGELLKAGETGASFNHAINPVQGKISASSLRSDTTGVVSSHEAAKDSVISLRLRAKAAGTSELTISHFAPLVIKEPIDIHPLPVWKITAQ